ncbi:MAG: cytochrome c biogenesis heme-transporting ATPase CcmA [Porticoccaceae bacterium]
MSAPTMLECREIAYERDYVPVFSGLSLSLSGGDMLQVSGPNGAGKTTLLRLLASSLTPSEGEILWRGIPLGQRFGEFRNDMLYLGHQPGIKGALSPRENLAWLESLGAPGRETVDAALAAVGLAGLEDVPCHTLSAGQQRRVALARLRLSSAALWILDEPFTAIDRDGVAALEALILEHARQGGIVVLTTHQALGLPGVRLLALEPHGRA